jgi:hypothetical protein
VRLACPVSASVCALHVPGRLVEHKSLQPGQSRTVQVGRLGWAVDVAFHGRGFGMGTSRPP